MAKILILSDTHLTHQFEPAKFALLKRIIAEHDEVIINGDFWDYWFTTFDHFVSSPWKDLFPLLLKKNTVYIHGNHDPAYACTTGDMRQFCVLDADAYTFISGKQKFTCTHGHLLVKGKRPMSIEFYGQMLDAIGGTRIAEGIHTCLGIVERILVQLIGVDALSRSKLYRASNNIMKSTRYEHSHWLLAGHSHYSEVDRDSLYANSGFIKYGSASYLSVTDGVVELIKTKY